MKFVRERPASASPPPPGDSFLIEHHGEHDRWTRVNALLPCAMADAQKGVPGAQEKADELRKEREVLIKKYGIKNAPSVDSLMDDKWVKRYHKEKKGLSLSTSVSDFLGQSNEEEPTEGKEEVSKGVRVEARPMSVKVLLKGN